MVDGLLYADTEFSQLPAAVRNRHQRVHKQALFNFSGTWKAERLFNDSFRLLGHSAL